MLHEGIIFAGSQPDVFYVECDRDLISTLSKHLKRYALRKRVTISDKSNELCVAAALSPTNLKLSDVDKMLGEGAALAGGLDPRLDCASVTVSGTPLALSRFVLSANNRSQVLNPVILSWVSPSHR